MIALFIGLLLVILGLIEQVNGMAVMECTNLILAGLAFVIASARRINQ